MKPPRRPPAKPTQKAAAAWFAAQAPIDREIKPLGKKKEGKK